MSIFSDIKKGIDKAIPNEIKNTVKGGVLNPIFGGGVGALADIWNAAKGGGGGGGSSSGGSGGGGEHGGLEFGSAMSASTSDVFKSLLKYAPQLAEMQFGLDQKYQPLRTELAIQMGKRYLPEQLEDQLYLDRRFVPQYQNLFSGLRTKDREADISDVESLAGKLQGIREASEDPAVTSLRKMLLGQVTEELGAGTRLTPGQLREVTQGVRASLQARGLEGGDTGAAHEAIARAMAGQNLLASRQGKAQSFLAQEASQQTDPFLAILSRPSTALSAGSNQYNSGIMSPVQASSYTAPFSTALSAMQLGSQNAMSAIQTANDNRAYELARLQAMQNGIVF